MKAIFACLLIISFIALNAQPGKDKLKNKQVLLFTKNGKGYVHENIPASIAAIQKLGNDYKFKVDTTTNSALFTEDNLKKYDVLIFSNTNNDVFDTEQEKVAFMRYIQAGGGFMGIHSASGTERNWTWFKLMLGATFLRHPPFQPFTVHVLDPKHPAVKNLPVKWDTKDEFYLFREFNPAIKVLIFSDLSVIKESNQKTVTPDVFGNRYPSVWCQEFDGGRTWYSALGHDRNDYSNPVYLAHIIEGLKWVTDKPKPDYKKAHATSSALNDDKPDNKRKNDGRIDVTFLQMNDVY
jgi:type 1 glutamine amidotransferase